MVPRLVQEIDGPGQLVHVAEKLVARHAGPPLRTAGIEPVLQAAVAQRHRDHQAIGDPGGELDIEQVAMADVADDSQRPLLHFRLARLEPEELQRNVKIARAPCLPDLAEPAPAQQADQRVADERFETRSEDERLGHGTLHRRSTDQPAPIAPHRVGAMIPQLRLEFANGADWAGGLIGL